MSFHLPISKCSRHEFISLFIELSGYIRYYLQHYSHTSKPKSRNALTDFLPIVLANKPLPAVRIASQKKKHSLYIPTQPSISRIQRETSSLPSLQRLLSPLLLSSKWVLQSRISIRASPSSSRSLSPLQSLIFLMVSLFDRELRDNFVPPFLESKVPTLLLLLAYFPPLFSFLLGPTSGEGSSETSRYGSGGEGQGWCGVVGSEGSRYCNGGEG